MTRRHRDSLLLCAAYDSTFSFSGGHDGEWSGRCIHCNRRVGLEADGRPFGGTTLEHIVPRHHGGTDELSNLAVACSRCNSQKGRRLDVLRRDDPRLVRVVKFLLERRQDRLREPIDGGCLRLMLLMKGDTSP